MKILMVCLGNICRSPLAEGIMRKKITKYQLNAEVDSAGTSTYHIGKLPDKRSIEVAKQRGVDLTTQRARQFSKKDFEHFDVIFAMDSSNYKDLIAQAATIDEKKKIRLFLSEQYPNEKREVPDPYYGERSDFENVYKMLDSACEHFIENHFL